MKVDAKIVPTHEKSGGFFSPFKDYYQLQFTILLTDVEKATLQKYGLQNYIILSKEFSENDKIRLRMATWDWTINSWINFKADDDHIGTSNYDTLIEAQAALLQLKENLTELKKATTLATDAKTSDSFEL